MGFHESLDLTDDVFYFSTIDIGKPYTTDRILENEKWVLSPPTAVSYGWQPQYQQRHACINKCRSDYVRYQAKPWKQPWVAFRGQGDAAVRQIASANDFYGYTIVKCVWLQYSSISQLTQADDVLVYTSDRSRSMYYVDHLDHNLPFWGAVQDL